MENEWNLGIIMYGEFETVDPVVAHSKVRKDLSLCIGFRDRVQLGAWMRAHIFLFCSYGGPISHSRNPTVCLKRVHKAITKEARARIGL
jgi:hypothetical protein